LNNFIDKLDLDSKDVFIYEKQKEIKEKVIKKRR
jgi:hypothetical protein